MAVSEGLLTAVLFLAWLLVEPLAVPSRVAEWLMTRWLSRFCVFEPWAVWSIYYYLGGRLGDLPRSLQDPQSVVVQVCGQLLLLWVDWAESLPVVVRSIVQKQVSRLA